MNAIGKKFRFILKRGEKVDGFTIIVLRNLLHKRDNFIFTVSLSIWLEDCHEGSGIAQ